MSVATIKTTQSVIRWHYLPWALLAIGVMVAAIVADNLWFLDYVHVFSSLLWTGIDLFMGFVLGPVLRRVVFTGMRDEEVAGLCWDCVRIDRRADITAATTSAVR